MLQWQKEQNPTEMTWDGAMKYCKNLKEDGHTDWRLPTIQELYTLINFDKYEPASDLKWLLPNGYWSSTQYVNNIRIKWLVYFLAGSVNWEYKTEYYTVRAVRGEL